MRIELIVNRGIGLGIGFGLMATCLLLGSRVQAKSPMGVANGKMLFEKSWTHRNPALGSDGLGPLFNGQSCVVCHNQGGVGGGGDATFNAKTLGIEKMEITGAVDDDAIARMVGKFHPGFVQDDGSVINTFTIPHHGGSHGFQRLSSLILSNIPAEFSENGGARTAEEVRYANATPILFNHNDGPHRVVVRARLFQRNTTSLYGAGLIDEVSIDDMQQQFQRQKSHPEISGRPATLSNGLIGKFGWRGNVSTLLDFVDQACANEVGLETKRKPQGKDPLNRSYRNPSIDIQDDQIRAMRDFISSLPAPVRRYPQEADQKMLVTRGEKVFAAVGCAVCHVPNLGPAKGIYSDLLLHDMGGGSFDLNHAEPYIKRTTLIKDYVEQQVTETEVRAGSMGAYYGATTTIRTEPISFQANSATERRVTFSQTPTPSNRISASQDSRSQRRLALPLSFQFSAPAFPQRTMNVISKSDKLINAKQATRDETGRLSFGEQQKGVELRLRIHYERTRFNQEWRTPPLWGVADSAPYMHDGRAETLLESITMHEGEATGTRDRFLNLSIVDRRSVIAFLETLVAPPNAPKTAL